MARSATLALALSLVALGACGGEEEGPDLTGVWRVGSHLRNETGCTPGPAVTDPPYIKFTREEFFGQKYFVYVDCNDAAGTDCEPSSGIFGLPYSDPIPDGYEAEVYTSSGGGAVDCALGAIISTAIVDRSGGLTIDTRQYSTNVAGLSEDDCNPDEAQARQEAGSLTCDTFEQLAALRE